MLRKQDALLEVPLPSGTCGCTLRCFHASTAASPEEDSKQTTGEIWEFKNVQNLLETFKSLITFDAFSHCVTFFLLFCYFNMFEKKSNVKRLKTADLMQGPESSPAGITTAQPASHHTSVTSGIRYQQRCWYSHWFTPSRPVSINKMGLCTSTILD